MGFLVLLPVLLGHCRAVLYSNKIIRESKGQPDLARNIYFFPLSQMVLFACDNLGVLEHNFAVCFLAVYIAEHCLDQIDHQSLFIDHKIEHSHTNLCFLRIMELICKKGLLWFASKSLNPFTLQGFPTDEQNHLVLDRVKSISAIWHSWELKG